ncbi:hypothetical protein TYRP_002142 [Tyrophagus putrescentiae]|nr:hypothetical protein TYRP_002142 [Tyrophagus putrescentiae]
MNLPQLFLHLLLICCLTSSKIECHFSLEQAIDRISHELEADAEYFQEMAKDKSGLYAELQKCVDFDLHNETFIEYCLKVALKVMTVDGLPNGHPTVRRLHLQHALPPALYHV